MVAAPTKKSRIRKGTEDIFDPLMFAPPNEVTAVDHTTNFPCLQASMLALTTRAYKHRCLLTMCLLIDACFDACDACFDASITCLSMLASMLAYDACSSMLAYKIVLTMFAQTSRAYKHRCLHRLLVLTSIDACTNYSCIVESFFLAILKLLHSVGALSLKHFFHHRFVRYYAKLGCSP